MNNYTVRVKRRQVRSECGRGKSSDSPHFLSTIYGTSPVSAHMEISFVVKVFFNARAGLCVSTDYYNTTNNINPSILTCERAPDCQRCSHLRKDGVGLFVCF